MTQETVVRVSGVIEQLCEHGMGHPIGHERGGLYPEELAHACDGCCADDLPATVYRPRYSGPGRTGICRCGHSWEDHHLSMVMNEDYVQQTGEPYIPEECEFYGFNETGGLDAEGRPHCEYYREEP